MKTTVGPITLTQPETQGAVTLTLHGRSTTLDYAAGEQLITALGEHLGRATGTIGIDEYEVFARWENLRVGGPARGLGSISLAQAREILHNAGHGTFIDHTPIVNHIDILLGELITQRKAAQK